MHLANHTYDQLAPGDMAEVRRLVTADDLYVFAASSGNYNPMHLSDADQASGQQVAPGMFVASLISGVLGSHLPGPGTVYRHQTLDFAGLAHAGEELICRVTVLEKLGHGGVRLATEVRRVADNAILLSGLAEVEAPTQPFDRHDI
ncbi:MAG: enoyl-CoA hydratase, partial [Rhodobacterales bacterium 17-64-5]